MTSNSDQTPRITRFYQRYLQDENSARFISDIAEHYSVQALERLARGGDVTRRRASVLALGFLGDSRSNVVMGEALSDSDRGVRVLAENGIRDLWRRDGRDNQRQYLSLVIRLNNSLQFEEAEARATELIESAPRMAEAWNQRAIARFHLDRFDQSVEDCRRVLELNSYHFEAAIGMAYCYLEVGAAFAALDCFRRAAAASGHGRRASSSSIPGTAPWKKRNRPLDHARASAAGFVCGRRRIRRRRLCLRFSRGQQRLVLSTPQGRVL